MKNKKGNLDDSSKTWNKTVDNTITAVNIGGATYSGAKSGAIIGSALGPWGTAIGGLVGGAIGGVTTVVNKWDTVKKWWPW
ncbi:hypothetical protein HPP_4680 [Hydrangea phyllody phytoplasma]|uniref:Bacteriocin n=1 Tax=Hydrangea phyllody phytoplasma TaxID=238673 RepID=A0ABQ1EK39_9MOLU|nr:hypothetical protein [Hydrangea phyllody phytoplasma]GFZ75510.1 hypothetical protein HPP_4680 [Hydrangea phyllody phytoplasma]GLH62081.1 hypothetical protein HP2P_4880 [Hydrangea phyllody phytoplasma]